MLGGKIKNVVFDSKVLDVGRRTRRIQSDQYLGYRYDRDGEETYNYVRYRSKSGQQKTALFLFKYQCS